MNAAKAPQRSWTRAEDEKLYDLRVKEKLLWWQVGDALGRTSYACQTHWRWLNAPDETRERKRLAEDARRRRLGAPMRKKIHRAAAELEAHIVPESVFVDRTARELAPRTITAIICGDPAPGWSALDRRQHEATA